MIMKSSFKKLNILLINLPALSSGKILNAYEFFIKICFRYYIFSAEVPVEVLAVHSQKSGKESNIFLNLLPSFTIAEYTQPIKI